MREQRKLAAVLAADVVGYSRLMGRDEAGTLARLKEHRAQRLEPVLARNGGRLVKLTGDGALAEFGSAVDALRAAIEFQQVIGEANTSLPEDQRIVFRVGLHVGDLIVDGDDLYGDGVNIAARLEAEAPPGGIIVSGALHEAAAGKVQAEFVDLGRLSLKNIDRQVQAYRVEWKEPAQQGAATAASGTAAPLSLPDKPSIAVLPFQNLSGDPEQEYFADGMVEDIITALSKFKSLFVIARNSSFTYKGKPIDLKQVGRDLGVRYVLEGSVRKLGDRLRVTAQLIETGTGSHLWAERYDRVSSDLFAIQDEMTESVVASIEPQLMMAEGRLSGRRRTTDLDAWGLVARSFGRGWTREALEEALKLLAQALQRDPSFARALAEASRLHSIRAYSDWSSDKAAEYARALQLAHAAVRHDPAEPWAYFARGWVLSYLHQYQDAVLDLSKAVELNTSFAQAHARLGAVLAYVGQPQEGISHTRRALRMSPRDPLLFNFLLQHALALFVAGRYDEAADAARQSVQAAPGFPNSLRVFVASAALADRVSEAQEALNELRQVQPDITLTWMRRNSDMPGLAVERFLDGLVLAGLCE